MNKVLHRFFNFYAAGPKVRSDCLESFPTGLLGPIECSKYYPVGPRGPIGLYEILSGGTSRSHRILEKCSGGNSGSHRILEKYSRWDLEVPSKDMDLDAVGPEGTARKTADNPADPARICSIIF